MSEMPNKKPEKKQTGKVNYVWVLAGGYLIYMAYGLFKGIIKGETNIPVISGICGVLFAAVGAWLLYREWKAYKFGQEHIDDPTTWSDEEAEAAEAAENEALPENQDELPEADEEPSGEEEEGEEE